MEFIILTRRQSKVSKHIAAAPGEAGAVVTPTFLDSKNVSTILHPVEAAGFAGATDFDFPSVQVLRVVSIFPSFLLSHCALP
jgi:hypothetical protein